MPPNRLQDHYLRFLPNEHRQQLQIIRAGSRGYAFRAEAVTSTTKFMELKLQQVESELEYIRCLLHWLRLAIESDSANKLDKYAGRAAAEADREPIVEELMLLQRQRKTLIEDIEDTVDKYETVEEAYTPILKNMINIARLEKKCRRARNLGFEQKKFKSAVINYYGARNKENNTVYCVVSGAWHPKEFVDVVRIVPKSLESEELSYLFGVGELRLSDPRNGLPLCEPINEAYDSGALLILPFTPEKGKDQRWYCILLDRGTRDTLWKDLDGKELKFLNSSRPASRLLYFCSIMTYLRLKRQGLKDLPYMIELEAGRHIWSIPQPYLRKSMILNLATKWCGDSVPDPLYNRLAFEETAGCASRPAAEEDLLATRFVLRFRDEEEDKARRFLGIDEEEEEDYCHCCMRYRCTNYGSSDDSDTSSE